MSVFISVVLAEYLNSGPNRKPNDEFVKELQALTAQEKAELAMLAAEILNDEKINR